MTGNPKQRPVDVKCLLTTYRRPGAQDPERITSLRLVHVLTPRAPYVLPHRGVPRRLAAIVCGSGALALASAGYLPFGPGFGTSWRAIFTVSAATTGLLFLVASCLTWRCR
jgi:hypothetical protein